MNNKASKSKTIFFIFDIDSGYTDVLSIILPIKKFLPAKTNYFNLKITGHQFSLQYYLWNSLF